jgi:hypothetical protein
MLSYDSQLPALLPMLSRGKHRNPRTGACFPLCQPSVRQIRLLNR